MNLISLLVSLLAINVFAGKKEPKIANVQKQSPQSAELMQKSIDTTTASKVAAEKS